MITRMCTGEVGALEMMTPSPAAGLDSNKKIAEVLVLATKMELMSIELE